MNHKTDMQAALQACVDALLHDGVPTDPEHPKRIALNAAEAAFASRPDAQADERYDLLQAAVNCPHEIESNRVVLHYSDKQPGHNALAQLRERLARTAAPQAEAVQGLAEDTRDAVSKALRRAWQLGQTYWQQADSESWAQQNKSDETQKKFDALVDETRAMLAAAPSPDREQVACVEAAEKKLAADFAQIGEAFMDLCSELGCPSDTNMLIWARGRIASPSREREQAPYSAPFTTDVPHCCGEPETCNDPCAPSPSRECAEQNPPFSNCSFRICDLPGQCLAEGKCHHPKGEQPRECGERKGAAAVVREALEVAFEERDDWLDDVRRAIRVYAHACCYDKSGVPAASAEIERLLAACGPSTSRDRGEQDCPHGVNDGACKQCYGEAMRGEQEAAKGVCQRCGGTGVVDDGEITGAGGVEFENGPVKCVKDCPDCADSTPAKAEAKCKACNGNDGDMPCAYPEGRPDCLRNASASTLGETVQGKPMATTAEFDVAIETLRHVIECLRNTGRYTDEEGEATDFLEPLLYAHLSAPQPQAAEPLIHWRDKPQNIALLAVERGDPVDCDGTFACPICGKGEPHQHSSDEIAKFRITQRQHKVIDALLSKADALIVSYTNVSGNHHGQLDSAIEMVRNARALLSKGE